MRKAELLQKLESLSPKELDEVADRIDQLRTSDAERAMLRDRIEAYRKNPNDVIDLEDAVAEILLKGRFR